VLRSSLAFLLLLAGCGGDGFQPKAGRNLLVVTIDTLRADRLGAYGYGEARTPNLDELARRGVLFENVIAPVPVTLPSHASLFTGLVPPTHGVRDNATFRLSEEGETLAEVLESRGYDTAAFVGAYVLDSSFGLDQGFAHYDDEIPGGGPEIAGTISERDGEEVTRAFRSWLERRTGDEPFFTWLHYFDPHLPYHHGGYDGEIAYVDAQIGKVLEALASHNLRDDTLVVITSDHGESLGEHGEKSHGFFVYDSTLKVPLILASPGSLPEGRRVATTVRTIDVLPTVLEALALPVSENVQGRSLSPLIDEPEEAAATSSAYAECYVSQLNFHWAPLLALREDGYKYIEAPRPELYDLEADPGETKNLADAEPERLARMRSRLADEIEGFPGSFSQRLQPDPETIARLRALGYAASEASGVSSERELADPKDRIHLWTALQEVILAKGRGDLDAAARGARAVLAEDPENLLALELLAGAAPAEALRIYKRILELDDSRPLSHVLYGNLLWQSGNLADAEKSFRAALERDAGFAQAHRRLAELQLSTGRAAEAVENFRAAGGSVSARLGLARSLRASGRVADSMSELEALHREHPESPAVLAEYASARAQGGDVEGALAVLATGADHHDVHYTASVLYRARGDMVRALEELDQALARDPRSAVALHDRGVILSRMGRLAEAKVSLESAVSVKDSPATRNALGTALCRMERCGEAIPHFERAVELAPEFVEALENLAQAYWISGRKADAERTQLRAESLARR
jgi:arylsulfatase A-like enzyme/Flp pilus assembly protein TadD